GPGPVPRQTAPGRGGRGTPGVRRPDQPARPGGPDRGADAGVRGGRGHHPVGVAVRRRPGIRPGGRARRGAGPGAVRDRRLMELWKALILGVVEGVTEFLPVSSTGHLTITEKLLHLKVDDTAVTGFTAVIQVGAILAAIVYFFRDIVRIVRGFVRGLFRREHRDCDYRFGWYVIAG